MFKTRESWINYVKENAPKDASDVLILAAYKAPPNEQTYEKNERDLGGIKLRTDLARINLTDFSEEKITMDVIELQVDDPKQKKYYEEKEYHIIGDYAYKLKFEKSDNFLPEEIIFIEFASDIECIITILQNNIRYNTTIKLGWATSFPTEKQVSFPPKFKTREEWQKFVLDYANWDFEEVLEDCTPLNECYALVTYGDIDCVSSSIIQFFELEGAFEAPVDIKFDGLIAFENNLEDENNLHESYKNFVDIMVGGFYYEFDSPFCDNFLPEEIYDIVFLSKKEVIVYMLQEMSECIEYEEDDF